MKESSPLEVGTIETRYRIKKVTAVTPPATPLNHMHYMNSKGQIKLGKIIRWLNLFLQFCCKNMFSNFRLQQISAFLDFYINGILLFFDVTDSRCRNMKKCRIGTKSSQNFKKSKKSEDFMLTIHQKQTFFFLQQTIRCTPARTVPRTGPGTVLA